MSTICRVFLPFLFLLGSHLVTICHSVSNTDDIQNNNNLLNNDDNNIEKNIDNNNIDNNDNNNNNNNNDNDNNDNNDNNNYIHENRHRRAASLESRLQTKRVGIDGATINVRGVDDELWKNLQAVVRIPRGILKDEKEMRFGLFTAGEMKEQFHNFHRSIRKLNSAGLLSPFLVVLPEEPLELGPHTIDFEMNYDKNKSGATPRVLWTITGQGLWSEIAPASSPSFGSVRFRYNGGGVFLIYASVGTARIGAISGVVFSLFLVVVGVVYVFATGKWRREDYGKGDRRTLNRD